MPRKNRHPIDMLPPHEQPTHLPHVIEACDSQTERLANLTRHHADPTIVRDAAFDAIDTIRRAAGAPPRHD